MTEIAEKVQTGRGPFQLQRVSATDDSVTLTYLGLFTQSDFDAHLAERETTMEGFVDFTASDFVEYQCAGPIRDLQSRGITVRNILTFQDGSVLGDFDLAPCPARG